MATITSLLTTSTGVQSRTILNTNFTNLNSDKAELSGATFTGLIQFSGVGHAGLKLNSLTTAQRDALSASNGMVIYNTTTNQTEFYEAGAWVNPSGVSDATLLVKGVLELASVAEVDAATATGGTGAAVAVTPDVLAASIYATRLPSADQKTLLNSITASAVELNILDGFTGTTSNLNEASTFFGATDISGAEAETLSNGSSADALHTHTYSEKIHVAAASVTVENTAVKTALLSATVPGGSLSTNNCIEIYIPITNIITDASSATFEIELVYGATDVCTASITTDAGGIDVAQRGFIRAVLYANGATNSQVGFIQMFTSQQQANVADKQVTICDDGTSAEDSTADKTISVTFKWSGADSNDTITARGGYIHLIR